jgi:hypothetical protein
MYVVFVICIVDLKSSVELVSFQHVKFTLAFFIVEPYNAEKEINKLCKEETGERFTKVIVNRKSKITLKISLRARIRAFH